MLYTLEKGKFYLANLAVHPDLRRRGIGRVLIEKLIGKLRNQSRTSIELCIRESNLPGQKFFRQLGFRALEVVHGLYSDDESEDAYLMAFELHSRVNPKFAPSNRLTSDQK
jgi:ribosomal-protein-alanine N-acetyltransferase